MELMKDTTSMILILNLKACNFTKKRLYLNVQYQIDLLSLSFFLNQIND